MDDNTKLNERLSVADLRMYEGKKDGKDGIRVCSFP